MTARWCASQFALAGLGAPLAWLGTAGTLLPMASVIAAFAAAAWLVTVGAAQLMRKQS